MNYNTILNNKKFFNEENEFETKYFDIFSNENKDIFKNNYKIVFNIEGNNIIINYNIASTLFRLLLSKLVFTNFNYNYKNIIEPSIFPNNDNKVINNPYYSSILFYYNCLNFYINGITRENSFNNLFENLFSNFWRSNYYFPKMKEEKKETLFYLNDYFLDLMLFDKIDYTILYSFLIGYSQYNKINYNNVFLLIFYLKEKWNIDFECEKQYIFKKTCIFYYEKLNTCLSFIKKGKTNIFISLLLLRRIFPIILLLMNYILNNNINTENIYIFSYENENIWDCIKETAIFDKLKNHPNKNNIIKYIISCYFDSLTVTMERFSNFGTYFNNDKFKNEELPSYANLQEEEGYQDNYNQIDSEDEDLDNIDIKEEENEKIEEDKIEKEVKQKMGKDNIVKYFEVLFYKNGKQKVVSKNEKDIKLKKLPLEKEYEKNIDQLKYIDNDYYYLFEITFYCLYLNLLEIYFKKGYYFSKSMLKFIISYEKNSLYMNFIDDEGSKTFIKEIYDKYNDENSTSYKLNEENYKSIYELREYLLINKKFKLYYDKKDIQYTNIIEKKVIFVDKEKLERIYPPLNEHELEFMNIWIR